MKKRPNEVWFYQPSIQTCGPGARPTPTWWSTNFAWVMRPDWATTWPAGPAQAYSEPWNPHADPSGPSGRGSFTSCKHRA